MDPDMFTKPVLQSLSVLVPQRLGALSVQALPNIGDFTPQCSIALVPRCFGILGALRATRLGASWFFEACAAMPSVPRCPRALVPWCFDASRTLCLDASTPRGFLSLCSGAFGDTLPQNLGVCPRCLEDSKSQRFDALYALSSAHCALGGPCTPALHSGTSPSTLDPLRVF
ncbi:UNVERIFIED_CONTAM: hypothetical protein FKN15_030134 [Acipenser sinensis]